MKKLFSLLLAFLTLSLCSIGLIGCSNNTTPPPEFSTIKLTSDNFNEYISVNFSCFDYEITSLNEGDYKYDIRMRLEISTTPRQPNILFSQADLSIYSNEGAINENLYLHYVFYPSPKCQIDANGYSNISCYIHTLSNVVTHIPDISLDTLKIYPSGYVKVQII